MRAFAVGLALLFLTPALAGCLQGEGPLEAASAVDDAEALEALAVELKGVSSRRVIGVCNEVTASCIGSSGTDAGEFKLDSRVSGATVEVEWVATSDWTRTLRVTVAGQDGVAARGEGTSPLILEADELARGTYVVRLWWDTSVGIAEQEIAWTVRGTAGEA